jgi:hypothetical protein
MTPAVVHYYLRALGSKWSGKGDVVELGCWLGATTRALLDGLDLANFDGRYYAYDRWTADAQQVAKAERQEEVLSWAENILPRFDRNTQGLVKSYRGEIGLTLADHCPPGPVEICLFDAPKQDPLFTSCMDILRPHFIPGVTVVGLLDYYFYRDHPERSELLAPVKYVVANAAAFEKIAEWPEQCSCVFFRYIG